MSRSVVAAGCIAVGLMTHVATAAAEPTELLQRRTTGLHRQEDNLAVSVGLQDLFGPEERQRLLSGFVTRVLIRIYLHQEGVLEPVAVSFQRSEIVYDIWDERFKLRITRGAGADVYREVKLPEDAIQQTCVLSRFPVAETRKLKTGARYFLAFRADLNPISEQLLADVRRWLVQPARGSRRVGAGDSVFGSFVSIFVNPRIEDSERQLRFLSQPFVPSSVAAPPARALGVRTP